MIVDKSYFNNSIFFLSFTYAVIYFEAIHNF
jgi:hypothetical protein